MKSVNLLSEQKGESGIGMIGGSSPDTSAEGAIKTLQATGGTEMRRIPVGMAQEDLKKGDGRAKVVTESAHGVGLRGAVAANDGEVTEKHGGEAFGLPDVMKVTKNGFAALSAGLCVETFVGDANGVVEVAELVEETALFAGSKVDGA